MLSVIRLIREGKIMEDGEFRALLYTKPGAYTTVTDILNQVTLTSSSMTNKSGLPSADFTDGKA